MLKNIHCYLFQITMEIITGLKTISRQTDLIVNGFVKSRCDAIQIMFIRVLLWVMLLSLFACELFLVRGSVVICEYVVSRENHPDNVYKKINIAKWPESGYKHQQLKQTNRLNNRHVSFQILHHVCTTQATESPLIMWFRVWWNLLHK